MNDEKKVKRKFDKLVLINTNWWPACECLYKIYMDDAEVKLKVLNKTFNLHKPSAQKLM